MPRSPDPINTWVFRVNQSISEADDLTMRAELMFQVKESIIGNGSWTDREGVAATAPSSWSVDYSCDSATAGTAGDAVDRWVDNGDLVWGTDASDAHSWVVLVHDDFFGVADPLYMLIALNESGSGTRNGTCAIYLSQTGFTGGTTTARPTAADELEVLGTNGTTSTNSSGWQGSDASGILAKGLHFMQSDDGTNLRLFITDGGNCEALWDLFLVVDADSNWDRPVLMAVMAEDAAAENNTWANAWNTAAQGGRYHGYDSVQGAFICEVGVPCYGSTETPHPDLAASTFGSRVVPAPIPVRGDGSPVDGPLAYVPDAWWVSSANGTGDTATDDEANARQFAQFGEWMVDWNRTVPSVS